MEKGDNPNSIESLTTRAFVLLRELIKTGKLSEAKTIELVEIFKEMPSTSFSTELKAFKDVMNAKYNLLTWVIGGATVVLSTVITLLALLGD